MSSGAGTARASAWAGLLPVDKPAGPTSHDVVARARRALGTRAIGHLGTLDPGASGLLVLLVGAATRCAFVWQEGRKTYDATVRFGLETDTQDTSGRVLATNDARPDAGAVRDAARALTGDILQVPPMVSALKVGGERLYAIARRGESVERAPRPVTVHAWEWLAIGADEARFRVTCSGGTYVRTLAHDLGRALGCGGALASLRRVASTPFDVSTACAWDDLDAAKRDATLARFGITIDRALDVLTGVTLGDADADAVGHGRAVSLAGSPAVAGDTLVLRDASGRALALADAKPAVTGGPLQACPRVVFPWAVREGSAA